MNAMVLAFSKSHAVCVALENRGTLLVGYIAQQGATESVVTRLGRDTE